MSLVETLLRIGPFLAAGWVSVSLARQCGWKAGLILFIALLLVMGAILYRGSVVVARAVADKHFGSAALASGGSVVYCYGVAFFAFVILCALGTRRNGRGKSTS